MGAVADTCAAFIVESEGGPAVSPRGPIAVLSLLQDLAGSPALVPAVAELVTFAVFLSTKGVRETAPLLDVATQFTQALRALGGDGAALATELEQRGGELARFVGAPARAELPVPTLGSVKASPLARFTLGDVGKK